MVEAALGTYLIFAKYVVMFSPVKSQKSTSHSSIVRYCRQKQKKLSNKKQRKLKLSNFYNYLQSFTKSSKKKRSKAFNNHSLKPTSKVYLVYFYLQKAPNHSSVIKLQSNKHVVYVNTIKSHQTHGIYLLRWVHPLHCHVSF